MTAPEAGLLILAFLFASSGLFVYLRRPTDRRYGLAFLVGLASTLWALSLHLISRSTSVADATFWTRMAFVGPITALVLYSIVAREYLRGSQEKWLTSPMAGLILLGVALMIGAFHPDVIERAEPRFGGTTFKYGLYYPVELLGGALLTIWTFASHLKVCGKLTGRERAQGQILLAGVVLSAVPALIFGLALPIFGVAGAYLYGPYPYVIALAAVYYAMGRHRLFDIERGIGPILRTERYRFHERVRESLSEPEIYLSPDAMLRSLQKALDLPTVKLALLDCEGRPTHEFGHPDIPVPKPEILFFRNGPVVVPAEVPPALQAVMAEQGISAVLRMGDPNRPKAVLTFGKGFDDILYSTQDFSLLKKIVRRLNLALEIAEASKKAVEAASKQEALPAPPATVRPSSFDLRRPGPVQILLLDPSSAYGEILRSVPLRDLEIHTVGTEEEFITKLKESPVDLALVAVDAPGWDTKSIMGRILHTNPQVPVLLLEGVDAESKPVEALAVSGQVLGSHRLHASDPERTARLLQSALLAGRYARGEIDLDAIQESAEAREKLFPILIASLAEAKDFTGMSRLFQRRLLEHTLKHSKTNVEAARKLGLSAPNLSLKLSYYKMEERAGGVKRTPQSRSN